MVSGRNGNDAKNTVSIQTVLELKFRLTHFAGMCFETPIVDENDFVTRIKKRARGNFQYSDGVNEKILLQE